MRWKVLLEGLLLLASSAALVGAQVNAQPGATNCFPTDSMVWKSAPGKAMVNNAAFHFKGVNYFGLEKVNMCLEGLNKRSMDQILDWLVLHKFNSIRVPFSLLFALSPANTTCPKGFVSKDLEALTSWEILDMLFERTAQRGILILLDMHQLNPHKGFSQLWYDEEFPEEMVIQGWARMLKRYAKYWNLFGLDIKNECHDQCSWGRGDPTTDFNLYCQRFITQIGTAFPEYKGLFLVEGIHMHAEGRTPSPWKQWWGGNLFGADKYPVVTGMPSLDDRIAYSPHIYGPDVYNMTYFSEPDFPDNLDDVWDNQFGWLSGRLRKAIIVGEWGGSCNGIDGVTQEKLAQWLVKNCMNDNFWWALNPGSEDTQGIMTPDWQGYDVRKMSILDSVQPDPSSFTYNPATKSVCLRQGRLPNRACQRTGYLRDISSQWEVRPSLFSFNGNNNP